MRRSSAARSILAPATPRLNDKQMAEAPSKILHFPTVLGADVITYNLPQLTEPLRFTGPVVADVFLGKITKWNDPAILKLNPKLRLPNREILTIHRSLLR